MLYQKNIKLCHQISKFWKRIFQCRLGWRQKYLTFTLGYCFILFKGVISRGSKKQSAISSTKFEYITLVATITKIIWLWKLLVKLKFEQKHPIAFYLDSQSVITLSENPKYHSWSKRVDTQHHFILGFWKTYSSQVYFYFSQDKKIF